jgi:hypothetical protein
MNAWYAFRSTIAWKPPLRNDLALDICPQYPAHVAHDRFPSPRQHVCMDVPLITAWTRMPTTVYDFLIKYLGHLSARTSEGYSAPRGTGSLRDSPRSDGDGAGRFRAGSMPRAGSLWMIGT